MSPSARTAAPRAALAALLVASLAACDHDAAREADSFAWSQAVPAGSWVRVRNTNGAIRVARASGPQVQITATKRYQGGRAEPVRFLTAAEPSGAVVCAVWESSGGRCSAEHYSSGSRGGGSLLRRLVFRRSSVAVDFVVALPAGVRLDASTVNGRVTVADAASEVRAKSVNGSVTVDARGGPVRATTVNGSVLARVADLTPGAEVALESVNGSVTAMVPLTLDAELDLRTTNGRVVNDLPVAAAQSDRRSFRGTLGAGGRRLSLRTVNGTVRLERATLPAGSAAPPPAGPG